MKCPYCGSTHVEEHGRNDDAFIWCFCRDCRMVWVAVPSKEETE